MEHLIDFFKPKHYKLDLFLNKHQKILKGTVKILGQIQKPGLLKLHTVGQDIDFLRIDGKKVDFKIEDCVLTALAAPLSDVEVEVGFHGPLNENMQGAYLSTYTYENREERIISTQFESHYAREAFPCVDEPEAKAVFELKITVPDEDDIVLANTECLECVESRAASANGAEECVGSCESSVDDTSRSLRASNRWLSPVTTGRKNTGDSNRCSQDPPFPPCFAWSFAPTPKMSTYLLAFVVGKFNFYEEKTKSGITVRTYAPLDKDYNSLKFPTSVAVKSLDYYEDLFQIPYPLKKLDQVAIPDFEAGAMENWGLVTYRESQLLCTESSSLAARESVALTVTHELSHQWFGNLVTMKWWNDLWLNESFATIMEYYATDHIFPEYEVWNDFFTTDCYAALYRDASQGVQSVREDVNDPAEIATLFDPCIVYAKGAHLMLMLIREMGEKKFFKGIKAYFEKKQFKNADADDLWASLNAFADFDVKEFMHGWLTQPGYPVITDGTQQRFLFDGSTDDTKYPLPEIRDDMSGHYLINLSAPEFDDALKNFDSLSNEQKLRLLIDRLLLSDTALVSSASLIPLIDKFKNQKSHIVWELINGVISKLTLFIDYDSPEETKYKAYIYSLVEKPLDSLGFFPKADESLDDYTNRLVFLSNAIYSKNPDFMKKMASLYTEDLNSLDSSIRPYILAAKMWTDEKNFYPHALELYKTATDPELKSDLRSCLAKPRETKNIDLAFSFLSDSSIIKPQDHLGFFLRLRRWKYTRDRALDWLLSNWKHVEKISGEKSVEDYPRYLASTIDTHEDSDKFFEFFTPMSENPVLARTLKVAKNSIDSTLSLIDSDKKSVLKAINKL